MIRKVIKLLEKQKLKRIDANCRKSALVGEKFKCSITTNFFNESGLKERIKIGNYTEVEGQLYVSKTGQIDIGSFCYINSDTRLGAINNISIGDYVHIAFNVHMYDNNNHPIDPEERIKHCHRVAPGGEGYNSLGEAWAISDSAPIIIEDNVWIGLNAFIGKGITIGEGSIVAAHAVVTKNVPRYTVVGGNPAKVIKTLKQPNRE